MRRPHSDPLRASIFAQQRCAATPPFRGSCARLRPLFCKPSHCHHRRTHARSYVQRWTLRGPTCAPSPGQIDTLCTTPEAPGPGRPCCYHAGWVQWSSVARPTPIRRARRQVARRNATTCDARRPGPCCNNRTVFGWQPVREEEAKPDTVRRGRAADTRRVVRLKKGLRVALALRSARARVRGLPSDTVAEISYPPPREP